MSTVEEQFAAVYAEQFQRLVRWLQWRLPSHRHNAEDLAQETFQVFWVELGKGFEVRPTVFGFLKFLANQEIARSFRIQSRDTAVEVVDFAEGEAFGSVPTSRHRYTSADPELSMVAAELDAAMERMQDASDRWRKLHAKVAAMRPYRESHREPAHKLRARQVRREEVHRQRDEALVELQEACRVVGNLRGELERLGGCGYRSSGGWPPPLTYSCGMRSRKTAVCDPALKDCPNGHPLGLEALGFLADGSAVCRACSQEATARNARKKVSA